jgi:hypothetical protein
MTIEYEFLIKNKTWTLVPLPPGNNLIGCKWVYIKMFTAEGHDEKYKERLVSKGLINKKVFIIMKLLLLLLK